MKLRLPDIVSVYWKNGRRDIKISEPLEFDDVKVSLDLGETLRVSITADQTKPAYIRLRFNFAKDEKRVGGIRVFRDDFERGYGRMGWRGIEPELMLPWYTLVSDGTDMNPDTSFRYTEGFGVRVQPNSFVTWQYDGAGISLWADIRCGGEGVDLAGRTLEVCEVVFADYRGISAFEAGRRFCSLMCPNPRLPDHKVYGSNNWYYAYGISSHEDIISDTKIVADQCVGLENIPYMVIDDGWQKNDCDAPWDQTRESFPDMKKLAGEMKALGVRPGIWIRYLIDSKDELSLGDECRMMRDKRRLDPSHPAVIEYVKKTTRMLREWGFELIKHDFSSRDIFGDYLSTFVDRVTPHNWHFYDTHRTSAEIVKDFYMAVREAAGDDCVIIGCNTVSHLCAGMYELNRTGDDTSGREWEQTRKMGVNTLAMRLIQNGTFYMADADCVGITEMVPWEYNRLWLDILSRSGSPLFVSCKPGILNDSQLDELKAAWAVNSLQLNDCRPLDWMENLVPAVWLIDGEVVEYEWYTPLGNDLYSRWTTE